MWDEYKYEYIFIKSKLSYLPIAEAPLRLNQRNKSVVTQVDF